MCPFLKKTLPAPVSRFQPKQVRGSSNLFWLSDSGSISHLSNDLSLPNDPIDCEHGRLPASTTGVLRVTKQGIVDIKVVALGVENSTRLLDVQYAENLEHNII